jgi:hypothetical protein
MAVGVGGISVAKNCGARGARGFGLGFLISLFGRRLLAGLRLDLEDVLCGCFWPILVFLFAMVLVVRVPDCSD